MFAGSPGFACQTLFAIHTGFRVIVHHVNSQLMKSVSAILLLATIGLFGCQHPTEVQVVDPAQGDIVVVQPVPVDTVTYQSLLDSAAISPADQDEFYGFMLVTSTQDDNGATVQKRTVSNVMFTDPDRPLRFNGRTFGYWGINIGPATSAPLTINGHAMIPIQHRIRTSVLATIAWGVEYYWAANGDPRFDTTYTWKATADSAVTGAIDQSIDAPKTLTVSAPKGGGVYSRDENLTLRWTAEENVLIYLSSVNQLTNDTRPLMMFKPLGISGRAVINSIVLKSLPVTRHYVLTFVLAHRKTSGLSGFDAKALTQAASVYNCYIDIR